MPPAWYVRHTWTMQEIAVSPSILYYCGQQLFSTMEIIECVGFLSYYMTKGLMNSPFGDNFDWEAHEANANPSGMCMTRLIYLRPLHNPLNKEEGFKLVNTIHLAMRSKATDPRDIVYGILALLPTEIVLRIHPNYDESTQYTDVLVEFSKACFQVLGNTDLLMTYRPSPLEGFPSWTLRLIDSENEDIPEPLESIETETDSIKHAANCGMHETDIGFSENNRLMYCDGAIVDTFSLLGGSQSEGDLRINTYDVTQKQSPNLARFTLWDWARSIARVFHQDSSFEFSDQPSVLDFPWLEVDELGGDAALDVVFNANFALSSYERDKCWANSPAMSGIRLFWLLLGHSQDIIIGERPLRDYFRSGDDADTLWMSFGPGQIERLAERVCKTVEDRRVCVTCSGLFGLVPRRSQLGDKIAVFSQCQMPVVVRPKGECYEMIGTCFVEGLMKGEVAEGIEQGRFGTEKICLC